MVDKDKEEIIRFLLARLALHKDTFNAGMDGGRIEELCFLINYFNGTESKN